MFLDKLAQTNEQIYEWIEGAGHLQSQSIFYKYVLEILT